MASSMSTAAIVKLNIGDKIKDQFVVQKKLGEGACGTVYLVRGIKHAKLYAAMKAEPVLQNKDDEILKMEVFVLKKLQKSKHACKILMSGRTSTYSFVIMSLLGKELGELRRRMPDRKMTLSTVLRIGIQSIAAIHDLHEAGFIHRDIKPANFSNGHARKDVIYLFDFGLARQIFLPDKNGNMKLREPRPKVSFRGTVRYCSINVHHYKEQGRHDDLISMLFMCIELLIRNLPWKGLARKDSGALKERISDKILFQGCPPSFNEIFNILKKTTYYDTPAYEHIKELLKKDMKTFKCKMDDPYDWANFTAKNVHDGKTRVKKVDERAEKEKTEDTDTLRHISESIETEPSEDNNNEEEKGCAKEDTLEGVKDC
uniref:Protein kinase domain-containing protein n=1 Tax=Panagrolaimus sp. PS1159 TaxID=55785 RepID=A0AC35FTQ7_9BILA